MSDETRVVWLSIAYVAALVFQALVGGYIGRYFAGRPKTGAALGFILGPLGWLMILCFVDRRRKCAACRSVADENAVACGRCGRLLPRLIRLSGERPSDSPP